RTGASARELKTVISNAAQNPGYKCLTPQAVLEELEALTRDKSVYEFLQQEVVDGYHDHEEFVRVAEGEYLDVLDEEVREAMGLISAVGPPRLEHTEGELDYSQIFPDIFRHLRDHFFDERKRTLRKNAEKVLRFLGDERGQLSSREQQQVADTLRGMQEKSG